MTASLWPVEREDLGLGELFVAANGPQPHVEYQQRPLDWIVEKMGVPRQTVQWSLNPGYEAHQWDGTLDPLARVLDALVEWQDAGLESGTTTGKAQPVDTPVLTPDGWRPIGSLRPGDFVIGRNGRPTEVLAVYPQGVLPVYQVHFADGAKTRACAEHLWAVQSKGDLQRHSPWRIVNTEQLSQLDLARSSWRVPIPNPVEFPERKLPLDPYTMGVLLGDGCFRRNGAVGVSNPDREILASVQASVEQFGVELRKDFRPHDYRLARDRGSDANPVTAAVREAGLMGKYSAEKHVPDEYLWASASQRLALLQGLLDTDGSITKNGIVEFTSASVALADAVVFLARSLGGLASKKRGRSYYRGRRYLDRYRVSIRLPSGTPPFRLCRKADRVKQWHKEPARTVRAVTPAGSAECVCIRVGAADSLYVTEDFIVTHNTYAGALLVLWFLACFEDSLVVTVAPKKDQLQLHIWKEIGRLWPRFRRLFPGAELTTLRIRMRKGSDVWSAHGFVAGVRAEEIEGSATKAQGFHAEHMLIVFEETPGNHPAIMAAFENTCRAPHNLRVAFGNPDHQHDQLHQFCLSPGVVHVRASALDHPNVVCDDPSIVPGAVSAERIGRARQKNGEHSPRFRSRVRGISPDQSTEALIRRVWCEEAVARYSDISLRAGEKALGVDVANSENGDLGAIAEGQGACCLGVRSFPCPDSNELGRTVLARMDADGILPKHVGVDNVGVGAGTVNELKWRGKRVRALNSGERAFQKADQERWRDAAGDAELPDTVIEEERYRCFRDQIWWQARIDLQAGRVALPNDPELIDDLTTVKFTTRGGTIIVEPKEKIRARLGRSTNKGDAFVYWNWVRPRQRRPKPDPPTLRERLRQEMREAELAEHIDTSIERAESRCRRLRGRRGGGAPGRVSLIPGSHSFWW